MIQGTAYDRFKMALECVPDVQDTFLIGIAIASENLLIDLQ